MKLSKLTSFFELLGFMILSIFCFSSCLCDCNFYEGENLAFLDKNTKTNLLFGANAKYKSSELSIFTIENQKEIEIDKQTFWQGLNVDSSLMVYLTIEKNKTFIVKLGNDTDTIDVSTVVSKGGCCGDLTFVKTFKYNGEVIEEDRGRRKILK
jgi:hypothetical protein